MHHENRTILRKTMRHSCQKSSTDILSRQCILSLTRIKQTMKLNDVFKSLHKETGMDPIEDSPFAKVKDFLSTNSLALNRICSGSVYKGIPQGRVTWLFGENSSGKSLIAYMTAINALKEGKIDHVIVSDSEGGVLNKTFDDTAIAQIYTLYIPVTSANYCS